MPDPEPQIDPVETSFFDAIVAGDRDTVRRLIEEEPVRVTLRSARHFRATPISVAAQGGDLAMIDLLMELGADIDAASDWWAGGWRPLHYCFDAGRETLADALIARGATIDVHAAAGLGRIDVLRELLDEDPELVHARGGDGCSPLHFARTPAIAALLLERGADLEMRDIDHESTPLQWVCPRWRETTRFLLENGAPPDAFALAWLNDVDGLRDFLDADPAAVHRRIGDEPFVTRKSDALHNYAYSFGPRATPLHAAATGDAARCVALLIERGMDPDVRGGADDATPLHTAAWHDAAHAAEALLDGGATLDPLSGKMYHNSPLGWAIVGGSTRVVDRLLAGGARITDAHRADAAAGAAGAFRRYSPGKAVENWIAVRARIDAVAPGAPPSDGPEGGA